MREHYEIYIDGKRAGCFTTQQTFEKALKECIQKYGINCVDTNSADHNRRMKP